MFVFDYLEDVETEATMSQTTTMTVRISGALSEFVASAGGFDVGTPDGQWGPASQRAMRAYQASVGLPETGAPDRATLESLGVGQ